MRDSLDEVVHGVFQNKMKKWGKKITYVKTETV